MIQEKRYSEEINMVWDELVKLAVDIVDIAAFTTEDLNDGEKIIACVDKVVAVTESVEAYMPSPDDWNLLSRQLLESMDHAKDFLQVQRHWVFNYRKNVSLQLVNYCTGGDNKLTIDSEESRLLCPFILEADIDPDFKALSVYHISMAQKWKAPLIAYIYGMKAFMAFPEIAVSMGKNYIFRPELLEESYQQQCPVCECGESVPHYCSEQFAELDETAARYFAPLKLWMKCRRCNTIYAYNFPVKLMYKIDGHYTENRPLEMVLPRFNLRICSDVLNHCRQFTNGRRYLEVGAGNGEMLATALEMGYDVKAVDLCREDCVRLSEHLGIDIQRCDFLDYTPSRTFDVIVMGNVLDQMPKPMQGLEKAYNLLAEDGVLWLSTPNYNSGYSRLQKWNDPMWNKKNHFTYFSYESLEPLLHRIGFKVVRYDVCAECNGAMNLYCTKNRQEITKIL